MMEIKRILRNIRDKKENYFQIENKILEENGRVIEIPWALSKYKGQRRILDVGTTHFDVDYFRYLLELLNLGVKEFHCIDMISFKPERFKAHTPNTLLDKLIFRKANIRNSGYPDDFFDLIFCISTIEHVGFDEENLNPREDTSFIRPEAKPKKMDWRKWNEDYKVLKELLRIVKPGGSVLLSIPFGKATTLVLKDSKERYAQVFIYDYERLQAVLNSFRGIKIDNRYFYFSKKQGWKETKNPRELVDAKPFDEQGGEGGVACIEIKTMQK